MHSLPKFLDPQIREIARVADLLFRRGWAERNAGNLSWRIPTPNRVEPGHDLLLITARNSRMRDLARDPHDYLLLVSADLGSGTCTVRAGKGEPTSEMATHLKLQQLLRLRHSEERVVLHTHPLHLTALTHCAEFRDENAINLLIRGMHPEIGMFLWEGVGWAPFRCPGSEELARAAEIALTDHPIALLDRHGVIAVGESPDDAFDRIDLVEKAARTWFLCRSAGFVPVGLTQSEIDLVAESRERSRLHR